MTVEFPANVPTSRSFTAPRWPTSSSRSQSGVSTIRLWGSQPSQANLSLSYVNIPDADAALFISRYNSAKGPITEVTLPSEAFTGLSSQLRTQFDIAAGTQGLRWFFPKDDPPRITSVKPGISSVQVNLVGELRMG
jgi:hypothetical protein